MSQLDQARTDRALRILVSGGGSGGHIFPAVAIADELKRRFPEAEFLFVGAKGRMEMQKVPLAGYTIEGLPISGLHRKQWWRNLGLPFKLLRSLWQSRTIVKRFQPDVAIGTGGYAGGPVLYMAAKLGVPTMILEPNAFAGLANKWLGNKVDKICIAFNGMERFFPKEKLVRTGIPVREAMLDKVVEKPAGTTQQILLIGGSQGAGSLNQALRESTATIAARPKIKWTWQCGAYYYKAFKDCATAQLPNVNITAFIDSMDEAYSQADLVIGRAGAITIAELCYLGKASVLVPSPNVAEDHQTVNAEALAAEQATVLVRDHDAKEQLAPTVIEILDAPNRLQAIAAAAKQQAQPGAVSRIVDEALLLIPHLQNSEA
ncbi:MAG: undecaprenyldiphospho-muramoylpentapeptide beta-N-acetylglucosaminyltransferase [Bacteroidota bacterium]